MTTKNQILISQAQVRTPKEKELIQSTEKENNKTLKDESLWNFQWCLIRTHHIYLFFPFFNFECVIAFCKADRLSLISLLKCKQI